MDLSAVPAGVVRDGAGTLVAGPARRRVLGGPTRPIADAGAREQRARRGSARCRRRGELSPMTTVPTPELDLDVIREFGPFRAYASDIRIDSGVVPDKTVKTHCCFCGQQ